jgi:hypothetical protein
METPSELLNCKNLKKFQDESGKLSIIQWVGTPVKA